ncbi:MAG: tetratricopeptide repeat protein [Phycisphaerales bacterium]|nr:tetratricopeptide repeat protein [Phycisphaerales bacterium]
MNTQTTIARARRDMFITMLVKLLLLGGIIFTLFIAPSVGMESNRMLLLVVIGVLWMVLSYQSIKGSRMAVVSSELIASGQYDEAEQVIDNSLRRFSLYKIAKLTSLHHLAVLRHAQKRYRDAAALCRELLDRRRSLAGELSRQSWIILANSLLELGDLKGAYEALRHLHRGRLSLSDALNLLQIETDYEAQIQAWEHLSRDLSTKAQLAELLPADSSARVQALLALGAFKTNKQPWGQFLRQRAELLTDDIKGLIRHRPILRALWGDEMSDLSEPD